MTRTMKKYLYARLLAFTLLIALALPAVTEARRGFSVGLGPVGNIFVIDTIPVLNPGWGGHTFFQYRFADQFAFQAAFILSTQSGTGVSAGDSGILFLGMPTVDLKYYFLRDAPRFDPFVSIGTGLYIMTEGGISNSTGGVGIGANLGAGFDYFFTPIVSAGFHGVFRSIAIISDFSTPSNSSAVFPFSLMANIAFHF